MAKAAEKGEKIGVWQQKALDKLLGQRTGGFTPAQITSLQSSFMATPEPTGAVTDKRIQLEREGTTTGK